MFGWFRKYVRKIGIFGVEVEFHPPMEPPVPATPKEPQSPRAPELPPVRPAHAAAYPLRVTDSQSVSPAAEPVAVDKAAFLAQVEEYEGPTARADYEVVLDDLIAWSEAQGGLLTFSPRPAKNTQATVTYRSRGMVFWDAWPQKRVPTKFTYEYGHDRAHMLGEFARLSADGRPASAKLPTVAFRDLVTEGARRRLKQLLGEALRRLANPPATTG